MLFSISRAAALTRLRTERLVSVADYDDLMQKLSAPKPARKIKGMKGRNRVEKALAELGEGFVGQALGAAESGRISYRDLTDYLSVGISQLDTLQESLLVP